MDNIEREASSRWLAFSVSRLGSVRAVWFESQDLRLISSGMPRPEFSLFRGSMLGSEDALARHNAARSRYHRVIADAVAALEPNLLETRLGLYARARKAFVTSLGHCDPPLAEAEFELERLAFEQVINRVEAQTTRQQRVRRPPAPKERRRKHRPAPRWRTKIANIAAGLDNLVRDKSTAVLSLSERTGWLEERRRNVAVASPSEVTGVGR